MPELVKRGNFVKVVDLQWFGNYLPHYDEKIEISKKSVSSLSQEDLEGIDYVIHLANIANDPGVELNPELSWKVNTLDFCHLLNLCKKSKIKKFVYASSGSVYGIKNESKVTEDLDLLPISTYNKTKQVAERVALSFAEDFEVYIVRPATVCGFSPRMRFDVVVNLFVLQAFSQEEIIVLGGNQIRPNIHIEDMVSVYTHLLFREITPGIYNAGFENCTVADIAERVSARSGAPITFKESIDPRSYRQDSQKLIDSGFLPLKTVDDAISEVWSKLEKGELRDDIMFHTVERMKSLGL